MKINQKWLKKQYEVKDGDKPDSYILAILRVSEKVLDLMEKINLTEKINANELILKADGELYENITGNMAGYVALIATKCHSRGEEFRKSWNEYNGKSNSKGVVNPAVFTMN